MLGGALMPKLHTPVFFRVEHGTAHTLKKRHVSIRCDFDPGLNLILLARYELEQGWVLSPVPVSMTI